MPENSLLRILPDIAAALTRGAPVVALESSVLAQGLPIPGNREAAERMTRAVQQRGATPAITAIVRGIPTLGLTRDELERFLARDGVRKVSARDLGAAVAQGADGATTVAATLALASLGGVRVFATGGIGGVHREPMFDESADLPELARTSMIVVCAGAKSILDLPATMERLETLGVPVVGYRTLEVPGFFTAETGLRLSVRADSAEEIARMFVAHRALGRRSALLVMQPLPAELALPRERIEGAVATAVAEAVLEGVRGAAMTPALLAAVERETKGRSLVTNLELLERNAALAAEIAVALEQLHEVERPAGLNSASSGW
ncbi:MAG TPA: pseudouridine-5'-phosphate glycosidase [Gemmatimonadaceae bacterium]|nr:pseudouridine-5'-phosphate glycosidase [Gemmatimonadaceae bacterium]